MLLDQSCNTSLNKYIKILKILNTESISNLFFIGLQNSFPISKIKLFIPTKPHLITFKYFAIIVMTIHVSFSAWKTHFKKKTPHLVLNTDRDLSAVFAKSFHIVLLMQFSVLKKLWKWPTKLAFLKVSQYYFILMRKSGQKSNFPHYLMLECFIRLVLVILHLLLNTLKH